MKAIILLICRSRFHIPRVGGFIHSEKFAPYTHPYQPFVFEGRPLDAEEFNEAAARLLDVRNANLGYEVSVRMVPDELAVEETPPEVPEEPDVDEPPVPGEPDSPEWSAPEPGTEYTITSDPSAEEAPPEAPAFVLEEGHRIMLGGERVAGLFGDTHQLRVVAKHADLRQAIEAWLETITPSDP